MEEPAQANVVKKRAPKTLPHLVAHELREIFNDENPEGRLMNLIDGKGWDGLTVYDRRRNTFTTALYLAAEAQNESVVSWLLATKRDDILKTDSSNGRTALHAAATNDNSDIISHLIRALEKAENVNVPDTEGNTPLHIAVEKKNLNATAIFLDNGADPCRKNFKGDTPLHLAVKGGNLEFLKKFLDQQIYVDTRVDTHDMGKGRTLLHLAMEADQKDMVALLINRGADPCQKDEEGASPLHLASLQENESVLQLLLHTAVKLRFQKTCSVEDIKSALEDLRNQVATDKLKYDWNIHNVYGDKTALHLASEIGNVSLVQALLADEESKKDVVKKDGLGDTALHAAASGGFLEIVEVLLKAGAAVNQQNKLGQSALHFAVGQGKVDIANKLLKSRADIHLRDHTGAGVLHFAARKGGKGIFELLLKDKDTMDHVNQATKAGLTPLHFAAWNGNIDALDWLLKSKKIKIQLDAKDKVENGLPWQWAAMGGREACLERLICEHVKRRIKVLPGSHRDWKRAFQRIEDHKQASIIDCVPWTFLSKLKNASEELEPGILSCAAAYGTSITNKRLVTRVLVAGKSNQPGKELQDWIQKLVKDSRLLEWAAWSSITSTEFGGKARFDAVKRVMEFVMKYPDVKAIKNQLKLAFKIVFYQYEEGTETFASCMANCCTMALPDMLKEVVWKELGDIDFFKKKYQELPSKYKDAFGDVSELVEDVPVAYWEARLEEDILEREEDAHKTIEKERLCTEEPPAGEVKKCVAAMLEAATIRGELLLARVKAFSQKFIEDYPNDKGPRTGRTALHWATIFRERQTIITLSAKGCKANIRDNFSKPPYWDAPWMVEEDTVLLNCLKWSGYTKSLHEDRQIFVDGLNAILVGSALIASVTFAGFLSPPLDYKLKFKDREYVSIDIAGMIVFWFANSLSFFFALAGALAGVTGVLPSPDKINFTLLDHMRSILIGAAFMLVLSIICVLVTFGAAGFSALPPLPRYQWSMIATSVPGAVVCFATLCTFIYALYNLTSRRFFAALKQCCCKLEDPSPKSDFGSKTLEEHLANSSSPRSKRYRKGQLPWEDGLDFVEDPLIIIVDPSTEFITVV